MVEGQQDMLKGECSKSPEPYLEVQDNDNPVLAVATQIQTH